MMTHIAKLSTLTQPLWTNLKTTTWTNILSSSAPTKQICISKKIINSPHNCSTPLEWLFFRCIKCFNCNKTNLQSQGLLLLKLGDYNLYQDKDGRCLLNATKPGWEKNYFLVPSLRYNPRLYQSGSSSHLTLSL